MGWVYVRHDQPSARGKSDDGVGDTVRTEHTGNDYVVSNGSAVKVMPLYDPTDVRPDFVAAFGKM